MKDYATLWVCIDCRMVEANGGTDGLDPDHDYSNVWSLEPTAYPVTPGLRAEEHMDDCPNFDSEGNFLGLHDEPCEDSEFSWTPCDGCGSTLGGSRHAYTVHYDWED